jgi:ribosomal protein S18 acetylase RimI-like enzyme
LDPAATIFCEAYAAPPYNESWEPPNAPDYLKRFLEIDPAGCFVAEKDNEIVGAIFSFSYPWHSGKLTCIQELFVSDSCRRQGVARTLMHSIKGRGAWIVAHQAAGAAAFYTSLGFRKDGPYVFYHGNISP